MSFGFSIGDVFILSNLAWRVVQKSRKACDEHENLTREVSALQTILQRLEQETENPESPINVGTSGNPNREELRVILADCEKLLRVLDDVLNKYNALSEQERSRRKVWQKVKFGNGEMANLSDLRSKVLFFNSSITFYLNILSMETVGRIEQEMNKSGGILRDIQSAVNSLTIKMISQDCKDGSVSTNYSDDVGAMWRGFRKELRQNGFSDSIVRKHKRLMLDYIKELGDRGFLDENGSYEKYSPARNDITTEDQGALAGQALENLASPVDCTGYAQPNLTIKRIVPSPLIKPVDTDETGPLRCSTKSKANPSKASVSSKQAMSHFRLPYIESTSNQSVERQIGAEKGTRTGENGNAGKGGEVTAEIQSGSFEDLQGEEKFRVEPQQDLDAPSSPHPLLSESSSLPHTDGMTSFPGLGKSSQTCEKPERRLKGTQALGCYDSEELRSHEAQTKNFTERFDKHDKYFDKRDKRFDKHDSRHKTPSPYIVHSYPPPRSKEVLPYKCVYSGGLESSLEEYHRQSLARKRGLQTQFSSDPYSSWGSEGSNSKNSEDSTQAIVGFNAPSLYTLYNRQFASYSPPTSMNKSYSNDSQRYTWNHPQPPGFPLSSEKCYF